MDAKGRESRMEESGRCLATCRSVLQERATPTFVHGPSNPEPSRSFAFIRGAPNRLVRLGMLFATVGMAHAADTATNTITLTIPQAVLTALARNPSVAVERMNPRIVATREGEQRAAFDPVLGFGLARTESEGIRTQNFSTNRFATENETLGGGVGLGLLAPTGTKLDLAAGATNTAVNGDDGLYSARLGATVTQPLLRGAGAQDQKIRIRQARLDTRISEYEFRGFLEAFVARVERSCWDHELARRRLAIALDSLKLAEDQLAETRERIRIGALAEVEKAASEAEVAVRLQAAIDSENALAVRRLDLARLFVLVTQRQGRGDILHSTFRRPL